MKKILAIILAVAAVLSIGAVAFAVSSPVPNPAPVAPTEKETEFEVADADGETKSTIPAEAVKTTAIDKADSLSEEDAAAFKAAYEEIQNLKDGKVYKFFWLAIDEEAAGEGFEGLGEDNALLYKFTCPGENVRVTVNSKEMKVENTEDNKYVAYLTEAGAVAVITD